MTKPPPSAAPILVVDDEEVIASALGEILRQAKYEVVTMSQPLAALEELRKREFSVIITDQRMPGLSGLDLLAEARRVQPNATRILITGVLNLDTVIEAINQGEIFRFIVKPWLREEFLATVNNGLQRYELLCQNVRLQAATQAMNEMYFFGFNGFWHPSMKSFIRDFPARLKTAPALVEYKPNDSNDRNKM